MKPCDGSFSALITKEVAHRHLTSKLPAQHLKPAATLKCEHTKSFYPANRISCSCTFDHPCQIWLSFHQLSICICITTTAVVERFWALVRKWWCAEVYLAVKHAETPQMEVCDLFRRCSCLIIYSFPSSCFSSYSVTQVAIWLELQLLPQSAASSQFLSNLPCSDKFSDLH